MFHLGRVGFLGRFRRSPRLRLSAGTLLFVGSTSSFVYFTGRSELLQLSDEGLPEVYDVEAISSFWSRHPRVIAWRLLEIVGNVLPFVAKTSFDRYRGALKSAEAQEERAKELKELLTNLGPTFIKFGQMLSTRPDLLSQPALTQLQTLCDEVPSFPTPMAREIIRNELGDSAFEAFEDFSDEMKPIAAASLGQVYKLRLKEPKRGVETMALKVQRPDMIRTVSLDLFLMRKYSICVEFVKEIMMKVRILSPRKQFDVELLDCFARGSYLELDYCNEGRNQERFAAELVPMMKNKVRVPKVLWELTSRKVLASEWIEGEQLVQTEPEVIARLVPVGVEAFLRQLLEMGFFHSDPHKANLLVDAQERLVLIDFGLCAQVPQPDTKVMTASIVHLMDGDVPGLLDDSIELGFLPRDVEKDKLLADLEKIFRESKIEKDFTSDYTFKAVEGRRRKFKEVSKELNDIFFNYPFLVPDYFALITRALIVLEGIAVTGNPNFDIFQAAYPYALRRSLEVFDRDDLMQISRSAAGKRTKSWFDFIPSRLSM